MGMLRVLLLLVLACRVPAQTLDPAALDAAIEETRKAFSAPGVAVAVVRGDEVAYLKGFGLRDVEKKLPVTPDTRFAIGSTTKAFTTTAMAVLVDDGKMAWDDPVRKHLPAFRLSDPLADANVTMRDIVCHRTGLSRHDLLWYNSPWSREDIIARIGLVRLTKPFRSAYQYQNIMFLTAGEAVGRIAGTSWEEFVRQRIFQPLGMNNSDLSAAEVVKARDHGTPHTKGQGGAVKAVPWRNIDNVAPAGSINSSVRDLARWVRMQLADGMFEGRRVVSEKNLKETHTPQMAMRLDDTAASRALNIETNMMSYGLGWVIQDYRGQHMVSHGGAIDGFRAQIALLPKHKLGIVILANLGGNSMPECLRALLTDRLLGLPAKDWTKLYLEVAAKGEADQKKRRADREAKRRHDTRPSRDLAAYAGAYEEPAYGTARVSLEAGKLTFSWSNWQVPLEHWQFDTFRAGGEEGGLADTLLTFRLNADGDIEGFSLLDQEFARRKDERK